MQLTESLERALRLFPEKPAIVCRGRRWTYRHFYGRVCRLATGLGDLGVGRGDRLAILHPNCHYFLETYYAAARAGAVCVPLNYRLSPGEIEFILRDSGSKVLFVDPAFEITVNGLKGRGLPPVIWTGRGQHPGDLGYEEILERARPRPAPTLDGESLAQIYYTSGTTGRPKGVMLSHGNVCTHALAAIAELRLSDGDVWVHAAPLFHLADAWATWALTWVGGTHVLLREFDAGKLFDLIEEEGVTLTNLIPTMLNIMVNHPEASLHDFRSLRLLLSGGAPIALEVVRKVVETFHCDYVQTYGMTETSPYLTVSIPKAHLRSLPPDDLLRLKAKTGREFLGVELRVVNEAGHEIKRDEVEVGEIIVRGDTVTKGYWNLPEETEKAIRDGWLHTGDMAVMDEEGYVTIVDRKKDMILTGGENVYSIEVENLLYGHDAVLECAVLGVPDEKWGEAVKAVVVLKPGVAATEEELIRFCKARIARYKAPKSIDFLDALPRTGSNKIHKAALRDHYWKGYGKKVH